MSTATHSPRFPCGHEPRDPKGGRLPADRAAEKVELQARNPKSKHARCWVCSRERAAKVSLPAQPAWLPLEPTLEAAHAAALEVGAVLEHVSNSGSRYYRVHGRVLRISDHEVPQTQEREHNRDHGGRGCCDREVIIANRRGPIAPQTAAREVQQAVAELGEVE